MAEAFLTVVNRGLSAGWLVLAVIVLRFVLKKAPRRFMVLLWGLVALRLVCPVSLESPLSLIPDAQPVSPEMVWNTVPAVALDPGAPEPTISPILEAVLPNARPASPTPAQRGAAIASILWCTGMGLMGLYVFFSYFRLIRRLKTAVRLEGNLFQCGTIPTPFVLGILRPRIYLPKSIAREDIPHVVAHERAHILRRDPLWKLLGFGLLIVYWFQPLLWLAYILLCRDMELACDERVIASLSPRHRADYSQALLHCSTGRRLSPGCPVAFGEVGVKERVKRVLSYRKPGFWVVVAAVLACAVTAACFLTDPVTPKETKVPVSRMSITAENVTSTGLTLVCHPDNAFRDVDAYTDSIYWLEVQNDSGEWQILQPTQWVEPALQPVEAPGQRTIHVSIAGDDRDELNWSTLYGHLPGGKYRVGINFWESGEKHTFYAEFMLDDPLVTPCAITGSLSEAESRALLAGDTGHALTREQTAELVGILNSLTQADFYPSGFINTPVAAVSLVSGDVTMELRYDGSEVQLLLDSQSAEALSDTRWCIYNHGLNAFFEELQQGKAG